MFESITRRFSGILGGLFRRKITEGNIRETLGEIRKALLEADVAYEVVNDFLARVEKEALGERVLKGVNPGQQFIAIVYEAMVELMGPVDARIRYREVDLTTVLLAGLQGSGKTTTCAKLALFVRDEDKRKPLLVAADVQRPAAIDQLKKLGEQIGVPVYSEPGAKPPEICVRAQEFARREGLDTVILDTAGRLHIDEQMMAEVREVARLSAPQEILLVCDAMTGQDAVRSAREFNAQLELTGVILTKLDGDARGGAALSVKAVTGKPIKFVGVGEKLEGTLEIFRPEGMAQRILGYGDVLELVQKARRVLDEKQAAEMQAKFLEARFDLNDFLVQIRNLKKMGSVKELLKLVPGFASYAEDLDVDDQELVKIEAMLQSMTAKERARPEILNTSRRDRIARGAGVDRRDLDDLLKQFSLMKKFMDDFTRLGGKGPLGKIKAVAQARRQLADIGGMMRKIVGATTPVPKGAQKPGSGAASSRPSKEDIRRRRKLEREARRKNRRR